MSTTTEYSVLDGRAKVIFHGSPNQERLAKATEKFIKNAIEDFGSEQALWEYLEAREKENNLEE